METALIIWVDYGNIAIGLGTFALAVILGVLGWKNSIRDRAIHIADKRQDWNKDFIDILAEIKLLQEMMFMGRLANSSSNIDLDEDYKRLMFLRYKLDLMFDNSNKDGFEMYKLNTSIQNSMISKDIDKIIEDSKRLDKLANVILENQRKKIAKLDSTMPLI